MRRHIVDRLILRKKSNGRFRNPVRFKDAVLPQGGFEPRADKVSVAMDSSNLCTSYSRNTCGETIFEKMCYCASKKHSTCHSFWRFQMISRTNLKRAALSVSTALTVLAALPSPVFAACSDAAAPSVDWSGCETDKIDLQGLDLNNAVLIEASFPSAHLRNAILSNADLSGANLYNAHFSNADLTDAKLTNANLQETDFSYAVLINADLANTNLIRSYLQGADASNANLSGADLSGANLVKVNFSNADLSGATLTDAKMIRTDLSGAIWIDGRTCGEGSIGECK